MEKYHEFIDCCAHLQDLVNSIKSTKTTARVDETSVEIKRTIDSMIVKTPFIIPEVSDLCAKRRSEILKANTDKLFEE